MLRDASGSSGGPHHVGHRERLRRRFLNAGADALADYELLELLLFLAVPRRDVKPLAKQLIERFGNFAGVIGADPVLLREFTGVGDTVITALKVVDAAMQRALRDQISDRPIVNSWNALLSYCKAAMQYSTTEQFRVLFLDTKNKLIADEIQQTGTVNETPVYPREVVRRALDLGASAVIVVHNHPSGDPTPSEADIAMTKKLVEAGHALGITLHDHLIVGREGHTSFKSMGLI